MAKAKLTSLYVKDKDGQESSVNIAESKEGLTSAVAGLQNKIQLLDAKLKNSTGKQTIGHSIGEIVKSKIPLDTFGYHELNGDYISEYSDYTDFYRYIESLYNNTEDETRYKITKNFTEYCYDNTKNKHVSIIDADGDCKELGKNKLSVETYKQRESFKYNSTFELHFDFTTGTDITTSQVIVGCVGNWTNTLLGDSMFCDIQDSKLRIWLRSSRTSSSWDIADQKLSNSEIHSNTHYHIKLKFDGVQYVLWLSENDLDFTHEWTISSKVKVDSNYGLFSQIGGNERTKLPFLGTLHLSNFYFIADDKETWRAFEKTETYSKKGFITNSEYNECLALSSQCNGIVFDAENRRVRLPTLVSRELVESKKPTDSDPYWFNLYSDGYCEQGSEFSLFSSEEAKIYQLKYPVEFKNYNYSLSFDYITKTSASDPERFVNAQVREKFKDQATIGFNNSNLDYKVQWKAIGYSDRHLTQKDYYYICIANGVNHLVIDKNTQSQLNIPFTLLEEKISYFKLSNSSWLLSEGQFNSGEVYKTVYNFLVEALDSNNSENKEISVKNINSEYNDFDFVVDTVKHEFRLPKKSMQLQSQVDFLNSVKTSANDNARFIVEKKEPTDTDPTWYILYNDGYCEQGGKLTSTAEWTDLNLLKPYKNTDYRLLGSAEDKSSDYATVQVAFADKTSSGAKVTCTWYNSAYSYPFTWKAEGYTDQISESTLEIGEYQSPLHLYFYVGETNLNYGIVDVGHLTEEVSNARSELNYYSKLLNEIDNKSDQYSYELAVKNNTKALVEVDYSKLYSEHMNKLFAMPDPDNTGTIIKFRTNVTKENVKAWTKGFSTDDSFNKTAKFFTDFAKVNGAASYSPMTLIDEFGRTLYLMKIAYAKDYKESSYGPDIHYLGKCYEKDIESKNSDGNYSFDLYFTYDKTKANFGSVVSLNSDQIPTYDVKAKLYCDIAQFDGRLSGGYYSRSIYDGYSEENDDRMISVDGFNTALGAVQNLFNIVSNGAWAYALNNVTLTFLNTRIKKCNFGVIRNVLIDKGTYYDKFYSIFTPQVANYDFSIETKYGIASKHFDQSQFTDTENFNVTLDLSEATNKARNLDSRAATYFELKDAESELNSKIDESVLNINNNINIKYNILNTQIQDVRDNLSSTEVKLQNQISGNKIDSESKIKEIKDLYTQTTKVKVISKEIEEQLELGTEQYDEDTLYLVDPTYENEKAVYDAQQAVMNAKK